MSSLQRQFFKEKNNSPTAPYTSNPAELSSATREKLINTAINQSERARVARVAGLSPEEIKRQFNTPVEMTVFSYEGPLDTIMTPRDSVLYTKSFLRTGFMSMEPATGFVKAYVGGPDFRFFQYDMAATGRRQIGSTIKPFLYTYAFETDEFTPCSEMLNEQPTLYDENGRIWQPRNTGHSRIGEMVSLRWALTNSNNWISARIMDRLNPYELVRRMHSYGITNQLPPVKSLCLGPCEVSVKEMVTAYSAFANKGMRTDPLYVTAIADANGNVIQEFAPSQTEVITERGHNRILSVLLNVVDSGTGNRLRRAPYNITAQMGGKTGTTNFNADGSWDSPPSLSAAYGSAATNAISISTAWRRDRAHRWPSQFTANIFQRSTPTPSCPTRRRRSSRSPKQTFAKAEWTSTSILMRSRPSTKS